MEENMRTVKELSDITGISVRTFHYYDEIGLLTPTAKSEAGYRLYDDKALETLQQILFFREFDLPLKKIKAIMKDPALDKNQILQMQREMLVAQKARTERLITGIDDILKGENQMDFAIFNRTEIEEMFDAMFTQMPKHLRQIAIDEFGGADKWRAHYIEVLSSEQMQKNYAKVVEWYGGKEAYQNAVRHPMSKEVAKSYEKRIHAIQQKLAAKRGCPTDSFEVKEIVGEYGFVIKQATGIKKERDFMLARADFYCKEPLQSKLDGEYGEGTAAFFAEAIETFYRK